MANDLKLCKWTDEECTLCLFVVNMCRAYGDAKHCRKLFKRILYSVKDWPESITEAYIQFEREEGDSFAFSEHTYIAHFIFTCTP